MGGTLLIAEHPGHLQALRANGLLDRPGTRLLAATAQVRYACERAGVPSVCPEEFYRERGLDEAGAWVVTLLDELERRLDPLLIEQFPALRRLEGAGPVGLAWWELHRLLSPYAASLYVLKRVLDAVRPDRIVCFAGLPERTYLFDYPVRSSWPPILHLLGQGAGMEVVEHPEPPGPTATQQGAASSLAGTWIGRLRGQGRLGLRLLRWLRGGCRGANHRAAPLLVLGATGGDLNALVEEAASKGSWPIWAWDWSGPPVRIFPPPFRRLPPATSAAPGNSIGPFWSCIAAERWYGEATIYEGVCLGPVLAKDLSRFCERQVNGLAQTLVQAEDVLERLHPGAVLTAYGHRREHVVQRLAALRGIPTMEYNHGAGMMASCMAAAGSPLAFHRGWRWADHVLAQGDGVRDYMERWHQAGGKTIPVGSAHLDRVKAAVRRPGARRRALVTLDLDGTRPIVVYVPSVSEGVVRFPPHRARSSGRQWQLEERVLAAAAACPDIQFVIKAYPWCDFPADRTPLEEAIADRGYRNCRVVRQTPLEEVLAAADFFVADCPSLLFFEMLTTVRPVALCGWEMPWPFTRSQWHPDSVPMWRDRVHYLETLEDIDKTLPGLFRRLPLPSATDESLLRAFGTHRSDGRSAERAWAAVERVLAGRDASAILAQPRA